jgi:uncharacterized protein (TIGR02413 family)
MATCVKTSSEVRNACKEVIHMTINLFFITLTLSVSKLKKSKEEFERNLEVQKRMEQSKEKVFNEFHNL